MQANNDSEAIEYVEQLKDKLFSYADLRVQLFRVQASEKLAKLVAILVSGSVLLLSGFFFLIFISMVGGFYFSSLLGSYALGFMVIAGFYLFIFILVLALRKQLIEKALSNLVVKVLYIDDEV